LHLLPLLTFFFGLSYCTWPLCTKKCFDIAGGCNSYPNDNCDHCVPNPNNPFGCVCLAGQCFPKASDSPLLKNPNTWPLCTKKCFDIAGGCNSYPNDNCDHCVPNPNNPFGCICLAGECFPKASLRAPQTWPLCTKRCFDIAGGCNSFPNDNCDHCVPNPDNPFGCICLAGQCFPKASRPTESIEGHPVPETWPLCTKKCFDIAGGCNSYPNDNCDNCVPNPNNPFGCICLAGQCFPKASLRAPDTWPLCTKKCFDIAGGCNSFPNDNCDHCVPNPNNPFGCICLAGQCFPKASENFYDEGQATLTVVDEPAAPVPHTWPLCTKRCFDIAGGCNSFPNDNCDNCVPNPNNPFGCICLAGQCLPRASKKEEL